MQAPGQAPRFRCLSVHMFDYICMLRSMGNQLHVDRYALILQPAIPGIPFTGVTTCARCLCLYSEFPCICNTGRFTAFPGIRSGKKDVQSNICAHAWLAQAHHYHLLVLLGSCHCMSIVACTLVSTIMLTITHNVIISSNIAEVFCN